MTENEQYFYSMAKVASKSSWDNKGLYNIDGRWIFCQWFHETGGFTSELSDKYHNLGGLTQEEQNSTPQPDGNGYYMQFNSYEAYADYFGRYLGYYIGNEVDRSTNLQEYITALYDGGYFGDSLDNYLSDCQGIYNKYFGELIG